MQLSILIGVVLAFITVVLVVTGTGSLLTYLILVLGWLYFLVEVLRNFKPATTPRSRP